jgi:hypothetical protein
VEDGCRAPLTERNSHFTLMVELEIDEVSMQGSWDGPRED